jgi:hypothetical protein
MSPIPPLSGDKLTSGERAKKSGSPTHGSSAFPGGGPNVFIVDVYIMLADLQHDTPISR